MRLRPAILALALCTTWTATTAAQGRELPAHPGGVPTPPLQPFVPPQPVRLTLMNGARLLVIESDELPLVDGTLVFRGGRREESPEEAGLAELMADVLREGGSRRTPGSALDRWLDRNAATLSIRAEEDSLRIDFSCVAEDLGTVLEFIGEILMIPAYPPAELEKSRRRMLTQIARRDEDAGELAHHLLDRVCYGPDSASARRPSLESVEGLTRQDLVRFHNEQLGADRLVVGATGAGDPDVLAARLEMILRNLPRVGPTKRAALDVFRRPSRTRIYLQDRPGVSQTEIRVAAPGSRRLHRDYVPLYLWSNAIGAVGTSNRMMVRLRTELGLIYRGKMLFEPGWDRSGRMKGSCSTGNEFAGEALNALQEILEEACNPIPTEEFEAVRRRLQNSLVFEIDRPEEVLDRALQIELYGNPEDFWERRAKDLGTVTREQVAEAVLRYLDVDRLVFLVVGPADEIQQQLEPWGEIIRLAPH